MRTKPEGGKMLALRTIIYNLDFGQEVDVSHLVLNNANANVYGAAKQCETLIYTRIVDGRLHVRLRRK